MRVVVLGGTEHVGALRAEEYVLRGRDVVVVSRQVRPAPWRVVDSDGNSLGPWARELDEADILTNMAGRTHWAAAALEFVERSRAEAKQ